MAEINVGDRVRIKNRPDWLTPPGYRLAGSEGIVMKIWEKMRLLEKKSLQVDK